MSFDAAAHSHVTTRRYFLARQLAGLSAALGWAHHPAVKADTPSSLAPHRQPIAVRTVINAAGQLKVAGAEGKTRSIPLKVAGRFEFVQGPEATPAQGESQFARYYRLAEAQIDVDKRSTTTTLRPNRRLIGVHIAPTAFQHYSPEGPLTRADLELLQVQFDPAALTALLPPGEVKQGDTWRPDASRLAAVVGLDAVADATLACRAERVAAATSTAPGVADVSFQGDVSGAVLGVKSTVTAQGQFTFDPQSRCIHRVRVTLSEDRAIGHSAPGLAIKADIAADVTPIALPPELAAQRAAKLTWLPTPALTAIDLDVPTAGYRLLHDRRWHVSTHNRELVVMRLVDRGEVVAQCNISPLAAAEATADPLADFRERISQIVSASGGTIIEASQATTDEGLQVLRILAQGTVKEIPITWLYFHLAADRDRRVACVVTLETGKLEKFGSADHDLIGGFQFLPKPAPVIPAAAIPAPVVPAPAAGLPADTTRR